MADLETEMEGEAVDANASSEPLLVEHGARTDGEDAEQLPEHHAGAEPDDAAETGAPAEAAQADAPAAADGGPDEPITADEGTRRLADGAASKLVADPAAAGAPPSLVHVLGKKLKVALPRGPPPAPRHLLFQSWWVESHTRRVVEVAFELGTERFRVTVDKEVHMLSSELLHTQRADSFLPTVAKDTKVLECFLHEKLSDNQRARSLELPHLQVRARPRVRSTRARLPRAWCDRASLAPTHSSRRATLSAGTCTWAPSSTSSAGRPR